MAPFAYTLAATKKVIHRIPFSRNKNFIGRQSQINEITTMLFPEGESHACAKVAVFGLGGVGKTQLALEVAYQTKAERPECSVLWIPATSLDSLHQAYLDIARQLELPGIDDDKVDVKVLLKNYLSHEDAGHWLLLFDNADDVSLWTKDGTDDGNSNCLINFLPHSNTGRILFTTRTKKAGVKLAGNNLIHISEMDEETATQLLKKSLFDKTLLQNHDETLQLLSQLAFLPLAIVQAAAYINENTMKISDYLSLLADQEKNVIDLLSEDFEDDWRYVDIKNPVATTWLISFDQIQRIYPLAAKYLSFMACIDPRNIPLSILPPAQSQKEMKEAIGTLTAYSFVKNRQDNDNLDLHRLVHLAMRNWLGREALLTDTTNKALERLENLLPDDDGENISVWGPYMPHARHLLDTTSKDAHSATRTNLLRKYSKCLDSAGRYAEAETSFCELREVLRKTKEKEDSDILMCMGGLSLVYRNQGKWKEAEKLAFEAVEIAERVLEKEDPVTLTCKHILAMAYKSQGRLKEAQDMSIELVEARTRVLEENHRDILTSMNLLMTTYLDQGRWKEAEKLGLELLEKRKKTLGIKHPDTLNSMSNLTIAYKNDGRWKEAEELGSQTLELRKEVLGPENPRTLTSMNVLASTYRIQGKWKEAEELALELIEKRKRVLGAEHPDTLTSCNILMTTYRNQGRWKEAETLGLQLLEIRKRVLGTEHPETLTSISNLVSTYKEQGRWEESEKLGRELLETRKKVLGEDHPRTLITMNILASTLRNQGKWNEAEKMALELIEKRKKVLGAEHPETLTSMNTLVSTYMAQNRWREAEGLALELVEKRKRVLGAEHPDTLKSMRNLASAYGSQGRWEEAEKLALELVETRRRVLGAEHPHTLDAMRWLESIQRRNGD